MQTTGRDRIFAYALLLLAIVSNGAALWPELSFGHIDLNDNVFHLSLIQRMNQAISAGGNPLDCWSTEWAFGYPVTRTYQPLAHWIVVALFRAAGGWVPILSFFVLVRFLAIVLLPVSFFIAARWMGLSSMCAAAVALLAPLISTDFLYGIEYGSFTWAGSGLFPQAVATHLLLLSIGSGWRTLRSGKRIVLTGVLVGLTVVAHLIYGYMAAATIVLLAVLPDSASGAARRWARTFAIGIVALALSAFQIVPLLADHGVVNHSRWEPEWKWDSFGAGTVLARLFTGELLDHGRLPVLTILAFGGVALWAWNRRRGQPVPQQDFLCAGAALWIAIYCGRPLWGPLLAALGMSDDMHLHRTIGGAHVFLVLLAASALAEMWRRLAERGRFVAAVALTIVLLYPMLRERGTFLANNAAWGKRTLAAYDANRNDLEKAIAAAKARGGRVYPGLAAGWGGRFKIGDAPFYSFLSAPGVPAVAFLYHSMALDGDLMPRFNDGNAAQYRLFDIQTAIAPVNWPVLSPAVAKPGPRFGGFQLYETPGGGYFDLVDAGATVRTTRRNFYDINDRWLQSDWPAKRTHLLLDWGGGAPAGVTRIEPEAPLPYLASLAPPAGQVLGEQQAGERYRARIDVQRPSYLLFKMGWHPNWKAYVDGTPQPVVALSPGFAAVAAPPGKHDVEFRYEPGRQKTTLAILGLIVVGLCGIGRRRLGATIERAAALRVRRRVVRVAGLAALGAPVVLPLLTSGVPAGHDSFEYFPRVVEAHRNLLAGTALLRWAPDLSRGYGQPLFIFRPPLFYWIAEAWRIAGLAPVTAVNAAAALLAIAAGFAMFRLGRLYFGETGGWIAAAACLYAPYFAVDLYVRTAFEEFAAFPFFALAFYGFGAYARERRMRDWAIGACAFGVLLCCHFPAALLFAPLLAAFAVFTAWSARSKQLALWQAAGMAMGLALGAWSWIPAIFEKQYVAMGRLLEGHLQYAAHFVYPGQLLSTFWGYGLSGPGPNDGMSFSIGWSHALLAAAACLWAWQRPMLKSRTALYFFAAAGAAICFLTLEEAKWIWDTLPLIAYVEFPWRLLGPAAVCLAMAAAALGPALETLGRWRPMAVAATLALLIVPNLPHLAPPRVVDVDPAFWTPQRIASRGFESTTAGETTPRWMQTPPPYDPRPAAWTEGDAAVRQAERGPLAWSGIVSVHAAGRVRLPYAYFPGWSAKVDGEPAEVTPASGTGLVEVALSAGEHRVEARFGRSTARLLGEGMSAAAVGALALLLVRLRGR